MNLNKRNAELNAPPTVIADLNGSIIHLNSAALTHLKSAKVGDNITKFLELDYVRKLTMFDNRIETTKPKNCKFGRVVVMVFGTGATKTIELYFYDREENKNENEAMAKDKKLFASYTEIISNDVKGNIKLNDMINEIVSSIKADLRFAYRKFEVASPENNPELYVNFSHISAVAAGTVAMLNEIEYKNPIKISVEKVFDDYVFTVSVPTPTFNEATGLHEVSELYPQIAMRLLYIAFLCDNDSIQYDFFVKPNRICASFIISEMINKTGKFSHCVFGADQKAFIAYVLSLFTYDDGVGIETE